jgi:hypothetical protein
MEIQWSRHVPKIHDEDIDSRRSTRTYIGLWSNTDTAAMRAEELLKPLSGTQAIAAKRAVLRFLPFASSSGIDQEYKSTTMSFEVA